jgi:hypothetical protein
MTRFALPIGAAIVLAFLAELLIGKLGENDKVEHPLWLRVARLGGMVAVLVSCLVAANLLKEGRPF